jgi:hypothetical protein
MARLCSRIPGSLVSPLASLLAMAYLVVLEHTHGKIFGVLAFRQDRPSWTPLGSSASCYSLWDSCRIVNA